MSNTGASLPGTAANLNFSSKPWNNVNNIKIADSSFADSADLLEADNTDYILATNFGFSIPASATIVGVIVTVDCYTDRIFDGDPAPVTGIAQLYNSGLIGNAKTDGNGFPGLQTVVSYGTSSDKWGGTLTPAIVNASTFGVALQAQDGGSSDNDPIHAFINYIKMNVYYTMPSGSRLLLGIG